MIMGTQSNPEALAGLRKTLGLNDPLSFNMDGGSAAWRPAIGDIRLSSRFRSPIF